jgi:hypothetical protein
MAIAETNISNRIMKHLSKLGTRLFRQNTGWAWQGIERHHANGDLTLINPRKIRMGLCPGSSDLIGWHPYTVTQADVGRQIAVFTALEVKTATGRANADQENFITQVRRSGGIAGVVRSEDEAQGLIV